MLERTTSQAYAEQTEELEPILPRNQQIKSKPILQQLPVEDIHIFINKTPAEEIRYAIEILKIKKFKAKLIPRTISVAGCLFMGLCIAGIVISAIRIDKYGRNWGKQPEVLAKYDSHASYRKGNYTQVYDVCGHGFPLKNVCHSSSINYVKLRNECNAGEIDCNLYELAWTCMIMARNLCNSPESQGFNIPQWQDLVMLFSCLGLVAGAIAACWGFSRGSLNVGDMNNSSYTDVAKIAEKYGLVNIRHFGIDEVILLLEKKAEEVSRPARRRAFLSAGLEQYKDSALNRFFKGVERPDVNTRDISKNPFATTEVKHKILDYAGLMPKTRLGR